MKTLLIDNYDSFTYNLFQLLAEANGEEPIVVRNDGATWAELAGLEFDNIVISPGPGRPDSRSDFGVCADAIAEAEVPLLGVCLGHQGLGCVAGGDGRPRARGDARPPERASTTTTRRCSPASRRASRPSATTRSASTEPLPDELEPIAWTSDGVLMGVAHRAAPAVGRAVPPRVDLHRVRPPPARQLPRPDARTASRRGRRTTHRVVPTADAAASGRRRTRPRLALQVERLDRLYDPEQRLRATSTATARHAFWLDSSKVDERSRFSFMGAPAARSARVITYDVADRRGAGRPARRAERGPRESIFDYLSREMRRLRYLSDDLPFDFNCGFVGYFGYELKADCEGDAAAPLVAARRGVRLRRPADRLRPLRAVHLRALRHRADAARRGTSAGSPRRAARLASLPPLAEPSRCRAGAGARAGRVPPQPLARAVPRRHPALQGPPASRARRYEVCLTNKVSTDVAAEPLRALPHAAPHQPGAVLGLPALRRGARCSAPRPSAS